MAAQRYLLLVSPSTELAQLLGDLLRQAGVSEPLHIVATDAQAATVLNHPDHEPPVAIFVDVPDLPEALRLIGWIVSSPTTHLLPVFAIVGSKGPQRAEVEAYKPTRVISHPLDLAAVSVCISLCPLLRPSKPPDNPTSPRSGSVNSIVLFC
jgi:hypothetical protein